MSLGILNNISSIYAQNNLNKTQQSLQSTLQELSSGARINSGADDAAGLAVADGLKANENALMQSAQNAANGIGLLQTADGALSQVTNLLDRAVTLATEAANGTLTTNQVSSANQEYQSIISSIGQIGSTTNFNGSTVFGSTATAFYVGDGTATGSTSYSDVIGTLATTSVGQTAATSTAATTAVTPTPVATSTATLAFNNAADTVSGTLDLTVAGVHSTISFAAGTTLTQATAQINASAAFSGGTWAGTPAVLSGKTITISNTAAVLNGTSTVVDTQGIVNYSAANANLPVQAGGTAGTAATATFPALQVLGDTLQGTLAVQLSGSQTASVAISFNAGTTIAQAVQAINSNAAFAAAGITASNTGGNGTLKITTAVNPNATTLTLTGTSLSDTPKVEAAGAGTDFTAVNMATLTTANAQTILTGVNAAIANVAYQRGILGADNNQLQAAANTAASENVNLTSAESSIRSTNYGEATSDLAKFEVLSQTGIAAMAQANSVQQEILKLLQ